MHRLNRLHLRLLVVTSLSLVSGIVFAGGAFATEPMHSYHGPRDLSASMTSTTSTAQVSQSYQGPRGLSAIMAPPPAEFDRVDANGDGMISRSEAQAYQNAERSRASNRVAEGK